MYAEVGRARASGSLMQAPPPMRPSSSPPARQAVAQEAPPCTAAVHTLECVHTLFSDIDTVLQRQQNPLNARDRLFTSSSSASHPELVALDRENEEVENDHHNTTFECEVP